MNLENQKKIIHWLKKYWRIFPQNINFYLSALSLGNYQVLEFLGDSVLDFVIADDLVTRFSGKDEGWLTKKRMILVNEDALAKLAKDMSLSDFVHIPETSSRLQITQRVLADIIEAMIGAIYKDQGLSICRESIRHIFSLEELDESLDTLSINPIGALQEFLAQQGCALPDYRLLNQSGKSHELFFTIEVSCQIQESFLVEKGEGKTKREASKNAAYKLLKKLQEIKIEQNDSSDFNAISRVQEFFAQRKYMPPQYKVRAKEGQSFIISVSCFLENEKLEFFGKGCSKKKAKHQAAQKLWEEISKKFELF